MILLLDNVDSFVHNLERYFVRLGHQTKVVRPEAVSPEAIRAMSPAALVLSPGPGAPTKDSRVVQIIRELWRSLPILGVCLGHQQIIYALGGRIERAPVPIHGRHSAIHHDGQRDFLALPNPFYAARYHSLVSPDAVPNSLEISARTEDDVVMAVRALEYPVYGWQFHPESILTPQGFELLRGFLRECGVPTTRETIDPERSLQGESASLADRAPHPITF